MNALTPIKADWQEAQARKGRAMPSARAAGAGAPEPVFASPPVGSIAIAFDDEPSWPLRLEKYRGTEHERAALESVLEEASRSDNAEWAYEVGYVLDNGDWTELDELMAAEAEAEREADRAYRYEARTNRCWDDDKLAGVV